jgi:hypothetical protein
MATADGEIHVFSATLVFIQQSYPRITSGRHRVEVVMLSLIFDSNKQALQSGIIFIMFAESARKTDKLGQNLGTAVSLI